MIPLNETTNYIISLTTNNSQITTSTLSSLHCLEGYYFYPRLTNILHKTLGCMEITTKNPKNHGKTTKHQLVYKKLDLHCHINASSMMLRTTAKSSEPLSCHWPMASEWNRFQPQKTRKKLRKEKLLWRSVGEFQLCMELVSFEVGKSMQTSWTF